MHDSHASPEAERFTPDEEFLTRYLIGDTSASETESMDRWLYAESSRADVLPAIRHWWTRGERSEASARRAAATDRALDTLMRRIDQPLLSGNSNKKTGIVNNQRRWMLPVAYAVAILTVATGAIVGYSKFWLHPEPANSATMAVMSTYTTGVGQRSVIMLPDGTSVHLNVASQLRISPDFLRGNRTVYVDGEALFSVTHRGNSPFTVISGNTVATVLGTNFLVRHYQTDSATTVSVRTGKVSVGRVVIGAMQEVAVGGDDQPDLRPADPARFSFVKGVLTLDDTPLSEAIDDLQRWYGADIRIADPSLDTRQITAEFASGSLADLADILELALGVRTVRTGKTLTLYPR